jgi:hypothetical protein
MSVHFKGDRIPKQETINALATMLLFASNPRIEEPQR